MCLKQAYMSLGIKLIRKQYVKFLIKKVFRKRILFVKRKFSEYALFLFSRHDKYSIILHLFQVLPEFMKQQL